MTLMLQKSTANGAGENGGKFHTFGERETTELLPKKLQEQQKIQQDRS